MPTSSNRSSSSAEPRRSFPGGVKGEVIKTVPVGQIVETLIEEALRLAEEMGELADGEGATPSVTVG